MQVAGKWGAISTVDIQKADVMDYVYQKKAYEDMIAGSEELKAYWYEAADFARVDTGMDEDGTYNSVYQHSPRILKAQTWK